MSTHLTQAKPMAEITKSDYLIRNLLLGKTGSGKTTSAALTLPGKTLVIDYDERAQGLAGFPNIEVLDCHEPDPRSPKAWIKGEEIRREITSACRQGKFPYSGVIEDGLSSMNRICMNWSLLLDSKRGLGGSPAKQHYGPQITNLTNHILAMTALPVHYILTGHFNLIEDKETETIQYLPKVFGQQMRTDVPTWFDECYFATHQANEESGEDEYFWYTTGVGKYDFMKSSLNSLGRYWDSPVRIDLKKSPAGYEKLLDYRFVKGEKDDKLGQDTPGKALPKPKGDA